MTDKQTQRIFKQIEGSCEKPILWDAFLHGMALYRLCDITLYQKAFWDYAMWEEDPKQALSDFWNQYSLLFRKVRTAKTGMFLIRGIREEMLRPGNPGGPKGLKAFTLFSHTARSILMADVPRKQKRRILHDILFLFLREDPKRTVFDSGHFPHHLRSYLARETDRDAMLRLWSFEPQHVRDMLEAYALLSPIPTGPVQDFLEHKHMENYDCGQLPYITELYEQHPRIPWSGVIWMPDVPSIPIQHIAAAVEHVEEGKVKEEAKKMLRDWHGFTVAMDVLCRRYMERANATPADVWHLFTSFKREHPGLQMTKLEYHFLQEMMDRLEAC